MATRKEIKERDILVATNLLEKSGAVIIQKNRCICTKHPKGKRNILATNNFYDAVEGSVFESALESKIPICKDCIGDMYQNYFTISQNAKWSIYKVCEKIDIAFIESIYDGTVSEGNANWQKQLGLYMKTFGSFKVKNGWGSFDKSESVDFDFSMDGNFEIKDRESKWSAKDKRVKRNVIDLIGYEPYEGYGENDQKFLYNDIIGYLDEESLDDQYKLSAIIQIVDNNNQIRKYQFVKNQYSSDYNMIIENSDKLNSLETLIKKLVENNDKIAKENGISVKNRKDGAMNKSSLTGKMKYLSENNFDDMEIDFYNQMTCYGMQRAESISLKAIKEQFNWDEDDMNEVLVTQRELIESQNKKILNFEEEIRKLNIKADGGEVDDISGED